MSRRRSEDRPYTVVLVGFLIGLVALGLLGFPALSVAAIGIGAAAFAILAFHRALEGRVHTARARRSARAKVPAKYVPSVLEPSSMHQRRGLHLRRHRHA